MSGVLVKYGGVAINSDKTFSVDAEHKEAFVKEQTLLDRDLTYKNIGNPCELYSVVLDGSVSAFPENPETENLGYWSNVLSDDNGFFESPIVFEFIGTEKISSAGISVAFDSQKGIFPTDVTVSWFDGSVLLATEDFKVNSAKYFFSKKVELYDRVEIYFKRLNMPQNRLKIQSVEFGLTANSDTDILLKNTRISRAVSPISTEIPINTFNFSFTSKNNIDYAFQERQPVDVLFNENLQGQFFVKSARRLSKTNYDVNCEDFFGILNSVDFAGGIYKEKNASELIEEIFSVAQIPFSISSEINSETVTGHIPYTTCREALKQVLFAIQAVADTSNSTSVKIYKIKNELTQKIPIERLRQGLKISTEARISAVEVTAHTYTPTENVQKVFEAKQSGTGENILIKFSVPLHSLTITNGKILQSGANFAVINANAGCILSGNTYEHLQTTKIKNNPDLLSTDTQNIKSVSSATLLSPDKLDSVLEKCYNYLVKTKTINAKIIESKHETNNGFVYDIPVNISDTISVNTDYEGAQNGLVEKQTYNLNGGILVKEVTMK
jgi:hypothetical protein